MMADFAAMRAHMVDGQILPSKVTDQRLIDAMLRMPREQFVPAAMRGVAYVDEDIEIAPGRFLMEPVVMARLIQAASIGSSDLVLDIGCATGYATAIMGMLAGTVLGLECEPDLAARASALLAELGVDNSAVVEGPLTEGSPHQAPFDVIFIGGAVADVPRAIIDQLAEGGRLVAVVAAGRGGGVMGEARRITRIGGIVSSRPLFDAAVPLMPGFAAKPGFVF